MGVRQRKGRGVLVIIGLTGEKLPEIEKLARLQLTAVPNLDKDFSEGYSLIRGSRSTYQTAQSPR